MYQLNNNPILTSYQVHILELFFENGFGKQFFLTGGTALAAFYFAHRDSKDLDLFTLAPYDYEVMQAVIRDIAKKLNATVFAKVKTDHYNELYLRNDKDGWEQRIDIVTDQPIHFGKIVSIDGIPVDSLENIASNKLLTIFGRLEPKDYIDFYSIVTKTKFTFESIYPMAKQKDSGLEEFFLAQSIRQIEKITTWPSLKTPLDVKAMNMYFTNLSDELLRKIKPKE